MRIITPTGVYGFDSYGTAVYCRGREIFLSHRDDDYEYPLGRLVQGVEPGEVFGLIGGADQDKLCVDLRFWFEDPDVEPPADD